MFINKGLKWPISNGEAVSVWGDFWLASSPLRKQIQGPITEGKVNISIKDFLSNDVGISFVLPEYVMQEIKGNPLASNPLQEDILIWAFSKDGNFPLKWAYLIAKGLNTLNLDASNLWA